MFFLRLREGSMQVYGRGQHVIGYLYNVSRPTTSSPAADCTKFGKAAPGASCFEFVLDLAGDLLQHCGLLGSTGLFGTFVSLGHTWLLLRALFLACNWFLFLFFFAAA